MSDPVIEKMKDADLVEEDSVGYETDQPGKRPLSLWLLSALIFLVSAMIVPLLFFTGEIIEGERLTQFSTWFALFFAVDAGLGVMASIATLYYKQWGIYLFIGLAVINEIVMIAMGEFNLVIALVSAAVAVFAFTQLDTVKRLAQA